MRRQTGVRPFLHACTIRTILPYRGDAPIICRGVQLPALTSWTDEALIALDTLSDRASGFILPSLRLGVTGLSRAGKTVFITALVHNLLHGGRLPLFKAYRSGRIARAYLQPQPDDAVPRFQYEDHVDALVNERIWPDSTRAISELRLVIEYESATLFGRIMPAGRLALDIVDYPGEWLLDLPLLGKDFAAFSTESLSLASLPGRKDLALGWLSETGSVDPDAPADEMTAQRLARSFTEYLKAARSDERALSTLPPGRFLMPGDLEGSPALTFAPILRKVDGPARSGSLAAMMQRRYEAYKAHVVKPFFRQHIARLDRQIVLVDAMQAMNAGADAVADLERALADILACFRPGRFGPLAGLLTRRIGRILIAATKADHLHHESHDRLEAITRRLVERAIERAGMSGAKVEVMAMAAVRATREATASHGGEMLPVITGTPIEGETIAGERFDGNTETAVFPGDLPVDPSAAFALPEAAVPGQSDEMIRFVRFRPPKLERTAEGVALSLPHIRLDRALEFLVGDRLA